MHSFLSKFKTCLVFKCTVQTATCNQNNVGGKWCSSTLSVKETIWTQLKILAGHVRILWLMSHRYFFVWIKNLLSYLLSVHCEQQPPVVRNMLEGCSTQHVTKEDRQIWLAQWNRAHCMWSYNFLGSFYVCSDTYNPPKAQWNLNHGTQLFRASCSMIFVAGKSFAVEVVDLLITTA